jgi:hypothetical protein
MDIVDFVVELVPVHVADLKTLERVVEKKATPKVKAQERKALKSSSKRAASRSSFTRSEYLETNISRIQRLSTVLLLPLTSINGKDLDGDAQLRLIQPLFDLGCGHALPFLNYPGFGNFTFGLTMTVAKAGV